MAKRKKKRAVLFAPNSNLIKAEIETDEVEAFWIKFVPLSGRRYRRFSVSAGFSVGSGSDPDSAPAPDSDSDSDSDPKDLSPEDLMASEDFCYAVAAGCVREWSLDMPCTPSRINEIEDITVIVGMANAIIAEANKRKNS